jgi:cell division protein FtsB
MWRKSIKPSFFIVVFFHLQYLTRQSAAVREVNDSRLKVYEQLEEQLTDLEQHNRRLEDEAAADKAKIRE